MVQKIFHLIGVSAFLGSVLSITLLARLHDFSNDWNLIAVVREDIVRLVYYITFPGLFFIVLSYILFMIHRPLILPKLSGKILTVLLAVLIINTVLMVVPAVEHLRDLALYAVDLPEAREDFLSYHFKEDLFGSLNLFTFLTFIILRLKVES